MTDPPRLRKTCASMCFMKTATPPLLPLLRSRVQGEVLAWVLLHPGDWFSLSEIAQAVGTSLATVVREVDRIADAGLIVERKRGPARLVTADTGNLMFKPLSEVLSLSFGPVAVLRQALADIEGIETAEIYGSWAARYAGEPGRVPADIDLLILGQLNRRELREALYDAEQRLGREINTHIAARAEWDADTSSFKTTVLSRPRVPIIDNGAGNTERTAQPAESVRA